jgi:hypothetical protein
MRIVSLDADGNEITYTDISEDGKQIKHRDKTSQYFYNAVKPFFMKQMSERVGKMLQEKIAERWQHYVDDPTPRWVEIVINKPGIIRHGKDMGIDKLVFGVGTFFHVGSPDNHFALREHALSHVKINLMDSKKTFRIITVPQGRILKFDSEGD